MLIKISRLLLILLLSCSALCGCATTNFMPALRNVPQNTEVYLNPNTQKQPLLSTSVQQKQLQNYLTHYFSPWTGGTERILSDNEIEQVQIHHIAKFSAAPGWGENQQLHNAQWIIAIANNMNMAKFPEYHRGAITINATSLRVLPTLDPSFTDWFAPGQGYPFDNLQESFVAANTPILILQTTRDGEWNLVLTHCDIGWLPTRDIAYVDRSFVRQWRTQKYVAPIRDHIVRLGSIYPFVNTQINSYKVLTAVADSKRNAVITTTTIAKRDAVMMPMRVTQENIADVANPLLGKPYGWGGMYGYRDCSATVQDLFTPFAIWLPRNSADQAQAGNVIDLTNLSAAEKEKMIRQNGVPFFTLFGLHGHIMLYIGQRNGQAYVLQQVWGVHTYSLLSATTGRAVIGQTVISPLQLGKGYINTYNMIDAVNNMVILGPLNNSHRVLHN